MQNIWNRFNQLILMIKDNFCKNKMRRARNSIEFWSIINEITFQERAKNNIKKLKMRKKN